MRLENKRMQSELATQGIKARVRYIWRGSMRDTWRIWGKGQTWYDNTSLQNTIRAMGFRDFDGSLLDNYSGDGGFYIFVRHAVLGAKCLDGVTPAAS